MNFVEMLEPTKGEPCQWIGVYVTRWQREWGEPSVMFRDVVTADMAKHPEVKALIEAARDALRDYGGCVRRAQLEEALAPFKVPE